MHAIGYRLDAPPYLYYVHVDAEGNVLRDIPIDTPDPTMQHDCALAGPHMVFVDPPLIFKPDAMVVSGKEKGESSAKGGGGSKPTLSLPPLSPGLPHPHALCLRHVPPPAHRPAAQGGAQGRHRVVRGTRERGWCVFTPPAVLTLPFFLFPLGTNSPPP